ncbi:hypothetical protein ACFWFI_26190 [Streptomyces sp. NPDC060209]|uniref:hypothetical protein n=1 Tax=Streptomyces sp. NPDC060209 TaxID=3347073 RepID=UPI00364B3439
MFGNDWYCFYQYKNFGGRRLQWNAQHDKAVMFSYFDFANRTSSWSNKGGYMLRVLNRSETGDDSSCPTGWPLWHEQPHTRSSSVSASNDNKADCFRTW